MCRLLTWSFAAGRSAAAGVGRGGEPVAGGDPEVLGVQGLGLLQPDRFVLGGEVGVAVDAVTDR